MQFITNSADRDFQGKQSWTRERNIKKTVPAQRWPAALKISAHSHEDVESLAHTQGQAGQQCVQQYQFSNEAPQTFLITLSEGD